MADPDPLLDALTPVASALADSIGDLEQMQEEIGRKLAAVRALRSELLCAADTLNRQRLRRSRRPDSAPSAA